VDVRILSATHRDLRQAIAEGRFREDLYFRLLVVNVRLPALREREGDIPLLATHFLDLHCERKRKNVRGFSPKAMRALERYPWPGNVRELENEVERLVVLVPAGEKIPLEALSERIRGGGKPAEPEGIRIPELGYDEAVTHLQSVLIDQAMERAGGVISEAARLLGMERSRLSKLRARIALARGGQGTGNGRT
jgi:two-component system response regulator HydG